ncbi:unnamed protein product [Pseudo-nitzschia multistriata]|uniref:Pentacotripeptide-repeat region of PRORP domain-containing protein n=1 Tax=Pseudo-nitzschia multistriata TaxID=183589 RepID=A0A448YYC3_9STRA|nr:unnamed protein product [Pseudo-nitzschia multistriata]
MLPSTTRRSVHSFQNRLVRYCVLRMQQHQGPRIALPFFFHGPLGQRTPATLTTGSTTTTTTTAAAEIRAANGTGPPPGPFRRGAFHLQSRAVPSEWRRGARSSASTAATAKTTATSIELKWRGMTDRILGLPVGTFDQGRWNEAITVLTYWFGNGGANHGIAGEDGRRSIHQNRTADSIRIETCWKILDRLDRELAGEEEQQQQQQQPPHHNRSASNRKNHQRLPPVLSTTDVLNPILVLWRDDFVEHHRDRESHRGRRRSSPSLPSEVARKLRRYEGRNLVRMDTATHAIVLDAAGKYSSSAMDGSTRSGTKGSLADEEPSAGGNRNLKHREEWHDSRHNQGVLFADRYLRDWINDYKRTAGSRSSERDARVGGPAQPDVVALGTVVHAWVESGLPGAAVRAEAWLKTWDDFWQEQENQGGLAGPESESKHLGVHHQQSKRNLYTFVLLAWARSGNPAKARAWIDRMIREGEYPDVRSFNCLLMAYQNAAPEQGKRDASGNRNRASKHNAECAEDVLRHMQRLYHDKDGFLSEPPNVASYNIVIDAWTKRAGSGSSSFRAKGKRERPIDAARRAHDWMEQMKLAGIPPNTITYNTVITAFSRAGEPLQSEKLLEEMITAHQNDCRGNLTPQTSNFLDGKDSGDTDDARNDVFFDETASTTTTKPDVQSFTSVLAGWARVGTFEAAERAEELLRTMQRPDVGIRPNVESFGACIHGWARVASGTHPRGSREHKRHIASGKQQQAEAVKRAEALFHEMREEHNIQPDVYSYTGLVNAYGRSGRAETAHKFLEACLGEYDRTKDPRMKPTVVTFTAILNAWSKASRDPLAAERAHQLLRRMKNDYGIQPNAFSYSAVLDAYARSDQPDAADKALRLFRDMRKVSGLEPNAYTCTNVLKAIARGGRVEEAEELLSELIHDERTRARLGAHAFSSVLYGWSKSKRTDAPIRAEALLIRMQELHRNRLIDEPPNAICCNSVLACWARSGLPGAAQRAEDLLRSISEEQECKKKDPDGDDSQDFPTIRPNRIMYNTVINAWANEGNAARANNLYEEFLERSKSEAGLAPPDEWTYRALWKATIKTSQVPSEEKLHQLKSLMRSMADSGFRPSDKMETDLQDILRTQGGEEH